MSESTATLYETDFAAWAQQQAKHLRAKRMTKLDYDRDNLGFHHRIDDVLGWAYPHARRTAARQTGLPHRPFRPSVSGCSFG